MEDARPWLAKLEGHVQDPARAQRLAAMLGIERPRLTFWAFQEPQYLGPRENALLHFSRSLESRLRVDEDFLAAVAHLIRWQQSLLILDGLGTHRLQDFSELLKFALHKEPEEQEGFWRLEAGLLAEAWILGMPRLPPPVEVSFPLSEADMDRVVRRWDDLVTWVRARSDRLRFDPASGRFVEVPVGQASLAMPRPAEPLPGWTGPVPQVP